MSHIPHLQDLYCLLNGMSVQKPSSCLAFADSKVYLDIEADAGGDINYYIGGTKHTLNCTGGGGAGGKARIEIPMGTSSKPLRSIVYVAYDETLSELTLETTLTVPIADFAPVCIISIFDYATTVSDGAAVFDPTDENLQHGGKGALSWMREKIRAGGTIYWSGLDMNIDITTNAGSEDDIDFFVSNGLLFPLLRRSFPNYDISTDGIRVINASGDGVLNPYEKITNLNSIHEIEDGTALNDGDSIVLVISASVNSTTGECKLFVSLPTGKYTTDADAVSDKDNYAVSTMPQDFSTTGILLCKLVLKYETAASGTWTNLLPQSVATWNAQAEDESSPNYPSNYGNNEDVTTTFTKAGAAGVRVHFDDFNTEAGYDYARILDGSDVEQIKYSGNNGAFTSIEITGDTLKIRFTSDGSVIRKGWHVDALEYKTLSVTGAKVYDLRGQRPLFN